MYLKTAMEVIVAVLAVFGIYCALKLASQKIMGSKSIFLTVEFKDSYDVEKAEMTVREAMATFLLTGSSRIVALISANLADDEKLMEILDKYGVDCYIVDE